MPSQHKTVLGLGVAQLVSPIQKTGTAELASGSHEEEKLCFGV